MEDKLFSANKVIVSASVNDFYIKLLRTAPEFDKDLKVVNELTIENLNLFISPQMAKQFLQALAMQINTYEDTFGEIRLEPVKKEVE